jgi:hypothetical protein
LNSYMGMIGLPSISIKESYGNGSILDEVPAYGWASNRMESMGGTASILSGNGTEQDVASIQGGMPIGTIAYVNLIAGVVRTSMAEPD